MISIDLEKALFEEGNKNIIGFDEAGRGPLAGPIVCGYVFLSSDELNNNLDLIPHINDSKKLTHKKRKELSDEIKKRFHAGVSMIDNMQIDKIGIQTANVKIVENIIYKHESEIDYALIDYIGGFKKYFNLEFGNYKIIVDGDAKHFIIASASIIAKVFRDEYMENIATSFPEYGFEKHYGYGTKNHIENIKKYGMCSLHRKSFIHFL
ncbi:MAG: ribonuclease HII [Patescibacteria group bacterium]|nr:ribonuclease HII [Patescibacteria group bacterium]MDD4303864.1 ribonuclease HII [Patescibacteria group bacterium]MDD4695149.1 ribonuclease HII [Patescibacteria group bacterium]